MLTSHRLLQQYWHDTRFDPRQVRVFYTDRGAPEDRSAADGPDIGLGPYTLEIRTPAGEKEVPYHRILVITYRGAVVFENRKVAGLGGIIAGAGSETRNPVSPAATAEPGETEDPSAEDRRPGSLAGSADDPDPSGRHSAR